MAVCLDRLSVGFLLKALLMHYGKCFSNSQPSICKTLNYGVAANCFLSDGRWRTTQRPQSSLSSEPRLETYYYPPADLSSEREHRFSGNMSRPMSLKEYSWSGLFTGSLKGRNVKLVLLLKDLHGLFVIAHTYSDLNKHEPWALNFSAKFVPLHLCYKYEKNTTNNEWVGVR